MHQLFPTQPSCPPRWQLHLQYHLLVTVLPYSFLWVSIFMTGAFVALICPQNLQCFGFSLSTLHPATIKSNCLLPFCFQFLPYFLQAFMLIIFHHLRKRKVHHWHVTLVLPMGTQAYLDRIRDIKKP